MRARFALTSGTGGPAKGHQVLLIGHPRTVGDWSWLRGSVAGGEGETLKVQASVDEGSSGGPVLLDGEVVGVVVAQVLPGIAAVKSVVNIRNFLAGYSVTAAAEPSPPVPVPRSAKLTVRSNVNGDKVSIDGRPYGPTRLDVDLSPGTHAVRVEKAGYEPFETRVELAAGAAETLFATLQHAATLERASPKVGETFRDCDGCPEMVVIPAGSFAMGSPDKEKGRGSDEGPVHKVTFDKPFAIARYEVTFDQWDACVRDGGCSHKPGDQGWGRDQRPVIEVSWNDAKEYVRWLSKATGKDYRLPSEAQWEYAARAGTTKARFWGEGPDQACAYANVFDEAAKKQYPETIHDCDDGFVYTAPVGSFKANGFGLADMLGNVWEWTEDCWNNSYKGAPDDGSAWTRGDCKQRVLRGGSWGSRPDGVRSAGRGRGVTEILSGSLGFRPARTF